MKKYQASTPDALVIGSALLAYSESLLYDDFQDILAEYGLTEIDAEEWYPQQLTLDIQKAIKERLGWQSLVSIGMKIIETAQFPPMDSLDAALEAFGASYPMNFKHQSPDDLIYGKRIADDTFEVINASPHSDDMIYGYIYALMNRFAPEGAYASVQFADYEKRDGDEDTRFVVTVKQKGRAS